MIGPQADFWYPVSDRERQYSGQLYSQNTPRGILAWRRQVAEAMAGRRAPQLLAVMGDRTQLVLVDDDPASSNNASGLIGLQVEGVPCKVSFRNIRLKKID